MKNIKSYFKKQVTLFFEFIRPYARPGWWTVKRWVEFMWFRNPIA